MGGGGARSAEGCPSARNGPGMRERSSSLCHRRECRTCRSRSRSRRQRGPAHTLRSPPRKPHLCAGSVWGLPRAPRAEVGVGPALSAHADGPALSAHGRTEVRVAPPTGPHCRRTSPRPDSPAPEAPDHRRPMLHTYAHKKQGAMHKSGISCPVQPRGPQLMLLYDDDRKWQFSDVCMQTGSSRSLNSKQ